MVQCPRCGHVNDSSSRFCVGCGNRLEGLASPVQPAPAAGAQAPAAPAAAPVPAPYYPPAGGVPAAGGFPPVVAVPVVGQGVNNSRLPYAETAPPEIAQARPAPAPVVAPPAAVAGVPAPAMPYHGAAGAAETPLHESPQAPRTLLGFLVSYDANPLGQFWPLHRGVNMLGRAGAATSAHVEVPHATVSSRHATIVAHLSQGGALPGSPEHLNPLQPLPANTVVRLFVSDHGSTNGTYVNDVALAPDQQRELHDGDRVRLGLFNLLLKII